MSSTSTYHSTINNPTVVSFDENNYNGMSELSYSTSTSDYAIAKADDKMLVDGLENLTTDDADYNNNINNNNSNNNNNNNNNDGMGDKDQYNYNDASIYNRTDSTTSTTTTNCHPSLSSQVGTYDDTFDAAAPSQSWLTGKLNSYKSTSSLASYSSRSDDITSTATTTSRKSSSNNTSNNKRIHFYANKDTKLKHWSFEEDENLKLEVNEFLQQQEGGRGNINTNNNFYINWEHIAVSESFRNTRSIVQCKNRWYNHLHPGKKQGNWEQWEDDLIRSEVRRTGFGNWVSIAKHGLPRRIPNQIRDRYVECLDSANTYKKKKPWSETEDRILYDTQRRYGNKWTTIRKKFRGRSSNDVKNRYYSTIGRRH